MTRLRRGWIMEFCPACNWFVEGCGQGSPRHSALPLADHGLGRVAKGRDDQSGRSYSAEKGKSHLGQTGIKAR
jgi:hypothetical protein